MYHVRVSQANPYQENGRGKPVPTPTCYPFNLLIHIV
jgi:hypothetical protein